MKLEDKLKDKYGTDPGFQVPENYFQNLEGRIMDQLPPYPDAAPHIRLSRWERLKPYVYLAAMFAGIWLMMKVFHTVSSPDTLSLDNPPQELVHLLETGNWDDIEYEFDTSSEPEFILEEEVIDNYDNIKDFEKDFGYTLKPEYSTITYSKS